MQRMHKKRQRESSCLRHQHLHCPKTALLSPQQGARPPQQRRVEQTQVRAARMRALPRRFKPTTPLLRRRLDQSNNVERRTWEPAIPTRNPGHRQVCQCHHALFTPADIHALCMPSCVVCSSVLQPQKSQVQRGRLWEMYRPCLRRALSRPWRRTSSSSGSGGRGGGVPVLLSPDIVQAAQCMQWQRNHQKLRVDMPMFQHGVTTIRGWPELDP